MQKKPIPGREPQSNIKATHHNLRYGLDGKIKKAAQIRHPDKNGIQEGAGLRLIYPCQKTIQFKIKIQNPGT